MLCLQSSHLGRAGARLYHLDLRWIRASSEHNHTCSLKSLLALAPISRAVSLASNTQVSKCLGLGLRPPEASSKLRALSTPAKLSHYVIASLCTAQRTETPQPCRAGPAPGTQHFSSQQGSSDAPGRQAAAKRHQKPPGNGLIGFIGLSPGPWSQICPEYICSAEVTERKAHPGRLSTARGLIPLSF